MAKTNVVTLRPVPRPPRCPADAATEALETAEFLAEECADALSDGAHCAREAGQAGLAEWLRAASYTARVFSRGLNACRRLGPSAPKLAPWGLP